MAGIGQGTRRGEKCIEVHQAMIFDRGGVRRLWQMVDVSAVRWTRELEKTSIAEIIIAGEACASQASIIEQIEPRRHELVLFRNGVRVWEGPIVDVAWYRDRVRILAHDVSEYLKYTPMTRRWPNLDWGGSPFMMNRVWQIINYELSKPYTVEMGTGDATRFVTIPRWENLDPPANILPFLEVRAGGILTRSSTEAFELTVLEHIDNLARGGMDWTVIGRKMLFWDRAFSVGQTRILTDNDFYGELEVYASGSDHWSVAHTTASPSEGEEVETLIPLTLPPHPAQQSLETRINLFDDPRAKILYGVDEFMSPWSTDNKHMLIDVVDPDGTTWVRTHRAALGTSRAMSMHATGGVARNVAYRFQCRVRASEQTTLTIQIRGVLSSGATGATMGEITVLPGVETRIDVTGMYTYIVTGGHADESGITINRSDGAIDSSFDITEIIIEVAPGGNYFDGDFPDTTRQSYNWESEVDNSRSYEYTQAEIPAPGWYNSRANLFKDPRLSVNVLDFITGGAAGTVKRHRETGTDGVADGPQYVRFTYTQDNNSFDGPYLRAPDMEPDTEYRFRCIVKVPEELSFPNLGLVLRGDASSEVGQSAITPRPVGDGEWVVDVKGTYTGAKVTPSWVFLWDASGYENYPMKNRVIDIREVLIEELPSLGDQHGYFDGSFDTTPLNQYAWYGAPDASVSLEQSLIPTGTENALEVGSAGGEHPYYGVWTKITSMSNEEGTASVSENELTTQAQRDLVGRSPVPIEIRVPSGGGIKPSFDLRIEDLVPGVIVPVRATLNLRQVTQNQRIDSVTVSENSEREEVGLSLVPWGDVEGIDP